jgi:hypothetical protein
MSNFKVEDKVQFKGELIIWHVMKIKSDETLVLSERDRYGNYFGRKKEAQPQELKIFLSNLKS